jgi:hypothetical protein
MLCPVRGGSRGGRASAAGEPSARRRRRRHPTAAWQSFPSLLCPSSEHQLSSAAARVGIHGRQPTGDGVHHTLLRACPCLFPFPHGGGDLPILERTPEAGDPPLTVTHGSAVALPLHPKGPFLSMVAKAKCPHRPCFSSSALACRCALDREERHGHSGGALCQRARGFDGESLFPFCSLNLLLGSCLFRFLRGDELGFLFYQKN